MNINQMNASLLGLFSGFPTHHFPDEIAQVLRENLSRRESLVFISAWPEEYARNDDDSDGMHGMFAERGRRNTPGTTMTATGCTGCLRNAAWRLITIV